MMLECTSPCHQEPHFARVIMPALASREIVLGSTSPNCGAILVLYGQHGISRGQGHDHEPSFRQILAQLSINLHRPVTLFCHSESDHFSQVYN